MDRIHVDVEVYARVKKINPDWIVTFDFHLVCDPSGLESIMEDPAANCTREVVIVNDLGMHARSAAMIAKLAGQAQSPIWLEKSGERADATSIIDMLSLGALKGSKISVIVDNPKDRSVLEKIVKLIQDGFGE